MVQHNAVSAKSTKKDLITTGIAGVAGLALLAGGTTFALWSDSATIDGVDISVGSLSVNAEPLAWFDTSTGGAPSAIEIADFTAIPGTSVRGVSAVDVVIDGSGVNADLAVSGGALSGNDNIVDAGTVYLFEGEFTGPLDPEAAVGTSDIVGGAASFSLEDLDAADSGAYSVVVVLEFDAEDGVSDGSDVSLANIDLTLAQV